LIKLLVGELTNWGKVEPVSSHDSTYFKKT